VDSTGKGTSPFNLKDFFDKAGNSAEFWRRDGKAYALAHVEKPIITVDMDELDKATAHALYIDKAKQHQKIIQTMEEQCKAINKLHSELPHIGNGFKQDERV
jgi:hypothetical protein